MFSFLGGAELDILICHFVFPWQVPYVLCPSKRRSFRGGKKWSENDKKWLENDQKIVQKMTKKNGQKMTKMDKKWSENDTKMVH